MKSENTQKKLEDQLKVHGLRNTAVRQDVLQYFHDSSAARSHGELEKEFQGKYDRVTLYRTLKSFEQHGLLHEVIDNEAIVKYARCNSNCTAHSHTDQHIHFKCESCQQTLCLDRPVDIPVSLPKGFVMRETQLLVLGVCDQCSTESAQL